MTLIRARMLRHLPYLAAGLILSAIFAVVTDPRNIQQMVSLATAYTSFIFVAGALLTTFFNNLSGKRSGLSNTFRRNLGIWSGVFAFAHIIAGLSVHFDGRIWLYFLYPADAEKLLPIRYDIFGFANHIGLAAAAIFAVLLYISNDSSIRRMGPVRWKRRQRLTYPLFAILWMHGVIYMLIEGRAPVFVVFLSLVFAITAFCQVRGFFVRRRIKAEEPRPDVHSKI